MQQPHCILHVARAVRIEQVLIEQLTLLHVVELQTPPFAPTQHTQERLLYLTLHVNWLVLVKVVVERINVILALKDAYVLLQRLQLQLFARALEIHIVYLVKV